MSHHVLEAARSTIGISTLDLRRPPRRSTTRIAHALNQTFSDYGQDPPVPYQEA